MPPWGRPRLIEEDATLNPGPYRISESLRSAKRALHLLVKRGEIVQMKDEKRLAMYITKETDRSLDEAAKGIGEGLARMESVAVDANQQITA